MKVKSKSIEFQKGFIRGLQEALAIAVSSAGSPAIADQLRDEIHRARQVFNDMVHPKKK